MIRFLTRTGPKNALIFHSDTHTALVVSFLRARALFGLVTVVNIHCIFADVS